MKSKFMIILVMTLHSAYGSEQDEKFVYQYLSAKNEATIESYRNVSHSALQKCHNQFHRVRKIPDNYRFKITPVEETTIRNFQASYRIVFGEDRDFVVNPTHQISIIYEGLSKFPEGHHCFSKPKKHLTDLLAIENSEWKVVATCLSENDIETINQRGKSNKIKRNWEQEAKDFVHDLDPKKKSNMLQDMLSKTKVEFILENSKSHDIETVLAKKVWEQLCHDI